MKPNSLELNALISASRAALLQIDADLFSIKQSLRSGDGRGGLQPFDRKALSLDDRTWVEMLERKVRDLNEALLAFGFGLPNPASA